MTRTAALFLFLLLPPSWALAQSEPAPPLQQDDEGEEKDEEKDGDPKAEGEQVDPTVKAAVEEVLTSGVKFKLGAKNRIEITYPMDEQSELADFESQGLDKVSVHYIDSYHGGSSGNGLEIGAGSRRTGLVQHSLPLTGDFEIELEMWVNHNTPSAVLCFVLSKKVAVHWGQIICKPKGLRPYKKGARPDLDVFGRERKVKMHFLCKEGDLTVRMNGRKTDVRRFKKGELDEVNLGIMARNMRFAITHLSIKGSVDPSRL